MGSRRVLKAQTPCFKVDHLCRGIPASEPRLGLAEVSAVTASLLSPSLCPVLFPQGLILRAPPTKFLPCNFHLKASFLGPRLFFLGCPWTVSAVKVLRSRWLMDRVEALGPALCQSPAAKGVQCGPQDHDSDSELLRGFMQETGPVIPRWEGNTY